MGADEDDTLHSESPLAALVRSAGLRDPTDVVAQLHRDHAVLSVDDLVDVLADVDVAKALPALWRVRLQKAIEGSNHSHAPPPTMDDSGCSNRDQARFAPTSSRPTSSDPSSLVSLRWKPTVDGPELIVMQGDLTKCHSDAIVNPANSDLFHGGGAAAAIARSGGKTIQGESAEWIRAHKTLPVGQAMATTSGKLPCRFVIHCVGPRVAGSGRAPPTPEQAQQLRDAVWNSLCEAEKRDLASIAIPGISSGIFGYPRDLATQEIVNECARYCGVKGAATTIKTITFLNIDEPTCASFRQALNQAAQLAGGIVEPSYRKNALTTTPSTNARNKASGILLVRAGANEFEVLLGIELRIFDTPSGRYVNMLGGRQEAYETPMATACREFSEEVGGLLTVKQVQQAMDCSSRSLYLEFAKYTLYIVHLDTKRAQELPTVYEKMKKKKTTFLEQDHLVWVSWTDLVAAASASAAPSSIVGTIHKTATAGGVKLRTSLGMFPLSALLSRMIENYGKQVEEMLSSLTIKQIVSREETRVNELKAMSATKLLATLLDGDWKLRLTSPPMPPPPPLELLTPGDSDYATMMTELPSNVSSRVLSVRRVRASARIGAFHHHKRSMQTAANATTKDTEPLFHGTPERWRATAIALNGFDLSITLCGRSMGNGVYTSLNVDTTTSYSGDKGSLLRLRGLVTSECSNPAENTVVNGDVHVFPNPRALLPLLIADYAAFDERDDVENQRQQVEDEFEQLRARRLEMETAMAEKETEFEEATGKRLRAALAVYSDRLQSLQSTPGGGTVSRHFFTERRHFQLCLPIYEVKPQLIDVLRTHAVVVVVAETGSGKSTQLPQILLDDVLPEDETRRIAVLEPRRVNAISLCKRVSEERGVFPGQEIGYTIGRGESNATEGTTRVEFMTHGLFVQLARDYDSLVAKYSAVIVDEAHERSVDVDLSLALLRRALKRRGGKDKRPFRVIVTSATIGDEAFHFQKYLDPALTSSTVFRIQGRTFPVHIEHRNDVQVDRQAVGTAGVGKVLTSAAIQTALELLRTTETGNILIFLPGEGSIKDALEIARHDIAMTATVESLGWFSSGSSSFCFRLATTSPPPEDEETKSLTPSESPSEEPSGRRVMTTCVVGFHGKVTRAERDHVLNPQSEDWRLMVFTTNIAETGVTIPNVRYVIDTGLQRRVQWNAVLDMNEMVTEPITLSSMTQRSGRAGRTASGICVRLYPAEPSEEFIQPNVIPAVQNAMIYKAVLLNKQLESQGEHCLELLDPIDPEGLELAEQRLVQLGALDPTDGKLTREGTALLRIGVDLRIGRFLIASARLGCLATGVKLASLLVAADSPERLLPDRKKPSDVERLSPFIDPSGDHLTLLNILEAYEEADRTGQGMSWCRKHGFDFDVFVDAEASREYLLKVLDGLRFPLADDGEMMKLSGGKQACIRRAICSAYYDQLARPRMANTAKNGFTRVLDESMSEAVHKNAVAFAAKTQAKVQGMDEADESDRDDTTSQASSSSDSESEEPIVKLATHSAMWVPNVAATLANTSNLVVFGSLILTDGSTRSQPTVQLVTCVSQEDIQAGAPEWCRIVDFEQLLESSARETLEFQLAPGMSQTILNGRGAWLTQLKKTFRSAIETTIRKGVLLVTCPRRSLARVEQHVRKQVQIVEPESVILQLPDNVNMGKIIGKGGQQVRAMEANIQELLSSENSGAGRHHVQRQRVLTVDTDRKTIQITLQGASKPLMGVVVGRIQTAIVETHGDQVLPLVLDASGERGQQMQQCPRLAQLLNRVPPTGWATRDDVMLQLAHALVWKCNASIYGGFLRDWVVRGEAANDIDVQLAPPLTTSESIHQTLAQFLSTSDGARGKTVQVTRVWQKGAAHTLTIAGQGIATFDVDLVDRERIKHLVAPPGVDCDAGNLLLNRKESLRKKILGAGDSLSSALENVRQKKFVFFYPLGPGAHHDMSVKRLMKYLSRGWTCLSSVPRQVKDTYLNDDERRLIYPVAA